jgi:hypothetical protein
MPDLTTLAAVYDWLTQGSNPTSDALLATLITATSADFLREIDRVDFMQADYTEVREGDGGDALTMRHWPIQGVTTLTVAGTAVVESAGPGAVGFYVEDDLDPERRNMLYLVGSTYTDAKPVIVEYTAGYSAAPADVAQAVTEWVASRYKDRAGTGVSSQRDAGGEHVAYDKDEAMPASVARVADRYRREWPSRNKYQDDRDYRVTRINRTTTTTLKG